MSIFLMLSRRFFAPRVQLAISPRLPPVVGSGAPGTVLMSLADADNSSSRSRWAVGRICSGSSWIKYWANFCSWSRCSLERDSLTGARNLTPSMQWIRWRQSATRWQHHSAEGLHEHSHDTIFFLSKVTEVEKAGLPKVPLETVAER